VEQFWVLQNQWGMNDLHDQGVFYMDASVDWFEQLDAYAIAYIGEMSSAADLQVRSSSCLSAGCSPLRFW
jgi:hypothetical protein